MKNNPEFLIQKNLKGPKASDMYAFATSKNGRTQKWFKDKESLARFLNTVGIDEYRINIPGEV